MSVYVVKHIVEEHGHSEIITVAGSEEKAMKAIRLHADAEGIELDENLSTFSFGDPDDTDYVTGFSIHEKSEQDENGEDFWPTNSYEAVCYEVDGGILRHIA